MSRAAYGYGAAGELTPRMLEVLRAGAHGSSASSTGDELGISRNTVRVIRAAAYARLGVSGMPEAVAELSRRGAL